MQKNAEFTSGQSPSGSVFSEVTRDYPQLLAAARLVLGDMHPMTIACVHASTFPSDRLSTRMVWENFQKLPVGKRAELLQEYRSKALWRR